MLNRECWAALALSTLVLSGCIRAHSGDEGKSHAPGEKASQELEREARVDTLDVDAIRRVVTMRGDAVERCYQTYLDLLAEEERLDEHTPLGGRMLLAISISEEGTVEDFQIVEGELGGEMLESCLAAEVSSWRFPPPPPGDAPVRVEIPFVFQPRLE